MNKTRRNFLKLASLILPTALLGKALLPSIAQATIPDESTTPNNYKLYGYDTIKVNYNITKRLERIITPKLLRAHPDRYRYDYIIKTVFGKLCPRGHAIIDYSVYPDDGNIGDTIDVRITFKVNKNGEQIEVFRDRLLNNTTAIEPSNEVIWKIRNNALYKFDNTGDDSRVKALFGMYVTKQYNEFIYYTTNQIMPYYGNMTYPLNGITVFDLTKLS